MNSGSTSKQTNNTSSQPTQSGEGSIYDQFALKLKGQLDSSIGKSLKEIKLEMEEMNKNQTATKDVIDEMNAKLELISSRLTAIESINSVKNNYLKRVYI